MKDERGAFRYSDMVLLDLASDVPEVLPPGMTGLTRIKKPLFGPPFTHPPSAFETIKMHFSASPRIRSLHQQLTAQINDLIQTAKSLLMDQTPLIIRVPSWMAVAEGDIVDKLCIALGYPDVLQIDGPAEDLIFPSESRRTLHIIPATSVENKISTVDDQILSIQSYFHRSPSSQYGRLWENSPLLAMTKARKTLRFGDSGGDLAAVLLLDASVAIEDTINAMLGSICAIIKVQEQHFEGNLHQHVHNFPPSLPRLPHAHSNLIQPSSSECLGLVYIAEVETDPPEIVVYPPIPESVLSCDESQVLLLMHPSRRQCPYYSAAWIAKEMEVPAP